MYASKEELQNFLDSMVKQLKDSTDPERRQGFTDMIDGCLLTLDALRVPYKTKTDEYNYTKIELI